MGRRVSRPRATVRRFGARALPLSVLCVLAACARFGFEELTVLDPLGPVASLDPQQPVVLSDGDGDGVPECSVGTLSDCSACGDDCTLKSWSNVEQFSCLASACGIASCQAGHGDCDAIPDNGCERPLNTTADCNGCDVPCALPNAVTTCDSGVCALAGCAPGFDNCDTNPSNGCETPLDTLSDCGGCGAVCNLGGGCSGGVCSAVNCTAPLADCDSDGLSCETTLGTLDDCASCGTPCGDASGRLANASASCASGSCTIGACDLGFEDCDGSAASGCEAQIGSDAHCTGCNQPCGVNEFCNQGSCLGTFASSPPSNVDVGPIDATSAPDLALDCGTVTIDTTSLSINWCGSSTPPNGQTAPELIVQDPTDGPDIVVIPVKSLNVAAGTTIRATGSRALAFTVFGDAVVAGSIDVGANGATGGAGNEWNCAASLGVNGTGTSGGGGGGGGGGAFGASGGRGGNGGGGSQGGNAGVARGVDTLAPLFPGCRGGWGGGCGAGPGGGGGALQISVTGRFELPTGGSLLAKGGDGVDGCGAKGGASGGGSGGAILVEANEISISGGTLDARGGTGGRGANGGAGGPGSTTGAGQSGTGSGFNGGGGGGGSAGRIRLSATQSCSLQGTSAPAPSKSAICP